MVYNLVFVMKMTVYTIWLVLPKGRASAISFYGWGFEWTSWIWNTRFVMNNSWCLYSRNQTSPKPIIYVDIWIYDCWSTVNLITVHTPLSGQPGIHRASAHHRRLTQHWANVIALINPDYYNILINFATHLVRTQFVLSVYKRRHCFVITSSVYLSSGYITII